MSGALRGGGGAWLQAGSATRGTSLRWARHYLARMPAAVLLPALKNRP